MVIRFGAALHKKLRAKPGHLQKSPQQGQRLTHVEDIMPTRRGSNREALRRGGIRQLAGPRVGKNDAGIGLPAQATSFNGISCLRKHATQGTPVMRSEVAIISPAGVRVANAPIR